MRDPRRREAGAVSVEFALTLPLLLMLVMGGIHLGRGLGTRHRLADATGFATRAAAVSGNTSTANVQSLILARLGTSAAQCAAITVTSSVVGTVPGRRLEVTARCTLPAPFGLNLLDGENPLTQVQVTAAMPF